MGVRNRIFALVAAVLAMLALVMTLSVVAGHGIQSSQGPAAAQAEQVGAEPRWPVDLDVAADRAETMADDVYNGLDTTKDIIGKTEARNQAIEHGRSTASDTLDDLADRARQAQRSDDEVLSETDKRVLQHLSE